MNLLSLQNLIQQGVDLFLALVGVDVEVGVTREHRRQLRLGLVIEEGAGNAMGLGIGQFVAHAQRGAGTLTDQQVALAQPCRVLVVDAGVTFSALLREAQVALAHVLGEHDIGALDIGDNAVVQLGIHAPAAYRPCKINLLSHIIIRLKYKNCR